MPLSDAKSRKFLNRRTITCEGYARDEGLLEIEGRLVDVRSAETTNLWRGTLKPGDALHDMSIRLTVDAELMISSVEVVTDSAPFPACRDVPPNLQQLVGLTIARGFKQVVRTRIPVTDGCTHLLALLDTIAATAVQTRASFARARHPTEQPVALSARNAARSELIDSCHGYAADGAVVEKLWPMHFRPRA
jgi:hypothetical protein